MSAADNHWTVYRKGLLVWTASVPLRADAPRDLLDWTISIIELAESTDVARFRKDDGTYWLRSELNANLERRLAERSVVDAFEFSDRFDRIGSKIAFHEDDGIREALIDNADALLHRLRPPEDDDPPRRQPPLYIGGHEISFDPRATLHSAHRLPTTSVRVKVPCDIWFPWVPGNVADGETFRDNRPLATLHTPRFNRFLGGLRQSVLDRGGTWERTFFTGESWLKQMLGPDDAIDLSAAAPVMPSRRGPWPATP